MNEIEIYSNNDLVISSFSLQKTGAVPIGNPTFEQWSNCLEFVQKSQQAVHFWLGDILNWGSQSFGEKYSQAVEVTGFDIGTLQNDCYVSKAIPIENRRAELSFEHHKVIAKLPPKDQKEWLDKTIEDNLTVRELRRELSSTPKTDFDKRQSLIDLEIAAKNFCEKNDVSREDMAIIVETDNGEKIVLEGKLKDIDKEQKIKLKFMFGE